MILSKQAFAAEPLLREVATSAHPTTTALALALGRDHSNTAKSVRAYEAAGWLTREGTAPVLTDEGRELLAALDRAEQGAGAEPQANDAEGLRDLPISSIRRNPDQPRKRFSEAELAELEASIRDKGVLQPILVRPSPHEPGAFEIVAGERRWRCAEAAGLAVIPALVRRLDDAQAFEAATVENVQRQDMSEHVRQAVFKEIVEKVRDRTDRLAVFGRPD